ncbi:MAG TPA: ABC transporter ATP-binding protein [Dehalococcoidia bacterium]|nr:ABC transporter ATP-binding protein [Dehalococcoidia bacterium]
MNIVTAPGTAPSVASLTATPAIEASDLVYHYGERLALDSLSLTIPRGRIFGLLGPNGSGKSTLLSILVGRRIAEAGAVRILGEPLSHALRRRVGVVFQEPSLDAVMTVAETMDLQARMFGLKRRDADAATRVLLERVSLADRMSSPTASLSGGMKRRLELARALLTGPEVLLLDEPTLALDPDSRLRLWEHLLEANAEGRTLLLATNDVHEAERYCDEVALIDHGHPVAQGTPADLKRELRDESVRIDWDSDPTAEAAIIETWPGVGHVRIAGQTTHVTVDDASPFLARLFQQSGDRVRGVRIEHSTLEDVYFQLVGRGITPAVSDAEAEEEA